MTDTMARSRALWNRDHLDLRSDEILAQLIDRGELAVWRELYSLAAADPTLRDRIARLVTTVPLDTGWFWQAALAALGVAVPWSVPEDQASL